MEKKFVVEVYVEGFVYLHDSEKIATVMQFIIQRYLLGIKGRVFFCPNCREFFDVTQFGDVKQRRAIYEFGLTNWADRHNFSVLMKLIGAVGVVINGNYAYDGGSSTDPFTIELKLNSEVGS